MSKRYLMLVRRKPVRKRLYRSAVVLLAALAVIVADLTCVTTALAGQTATASGTQICWQDGALHMKAGEERIRKEVREAFISPLKRVPLKSAHKLAVQRLAIRRVKLPPGKRLVALTFDLCEQPYEVAGYQGAIPDYLRTHGVKATFFAGGKWMLTHRERTQQLMADPLFEIGNHTWEHRNLRLLSGSALVAEVERAQTAYEQVREELKQRQCISRDGVTLAHERARPKLDLFRFPFGACNQQSLNAVGDMGLAAIQWDVSSGDPWNGQKPEAMVQAVMAHVQPGSIILFHANGRGWHTGEALPRIIDALQKQGYGFATVSELLAAGEPVYSETCYDSRLGDTDRYDDLARRLEVSYERARAHVMGTSEGEATKAADQAVAPAPVSSTPKKPKPALGSTAKNPTNSSGELKPALQWQQ